ncbi:hypothetical protein Nmel_009256 [Mimus melanotis]
MRLEAVTDPNKLDCGNYGPDKRKEDSKFVSSSLDCEAYAFKRKEDKRIEKHLKIKLEESTESNQPKQVPSLLKRLDSAPRLFLPCASAQTERQNLVTSQTYTCCVRTGVDLPEQAKRVTTASLSCDSPGYARQRGRILPGEQGKASAAALPQPLGPPEGMAAAAHQHLRTHRATQLHTYTCTPASPHILNP